MLVVNYNGNKPISDYFKFSVQGNNKADIVRFVLPIQQSTITLTDSDSFFVKCESEDEDFIDKMQLDDIEFSGNYVYVNWVLLKKHTQNKQLKVSLCVENDDEVVFNTQLFTMKISNGLDVDDEIENNYPTILQQLQDQINSLSGGGGVSDVAIKRIYLSYILSDDDEDNPSNIDTIGVNDPTKIFINMETTPIDSNIENEIKNGRFVIRFDYPIRHSKRLKNMRPSGMGVRSFAYNLHYYDKDDEEYKNIAFKQQLIKSLIFITENDVYTNAYGEKYIYKQLSFLELMDKFYNINNGETLLTRQEGLESNLYVSGIPMTPQTEEANNSYKEFGKSMTRMKNGAYFYLLQAIQHYTGASRYSFDRTSFAYAPICVPLNYNDRYKVASPFYLSKSHPSVVFSFRTTYVVERYTADDEAEQSGTHFSNARAIVSVNPRCCVIDENYATKTNGSIWLKKYSQSTQRIKCVIREFSVPNDSEYAFATCVLKIK